MDTSHSTRVQDVCPECGDPIDVEIWNIIDVDARNDLFFLAREGLLNRFACSNDHVIAIGTTLLFYGHIHQDTLLHDTAMTWQMNNASSPLARSLSKNDPLLIISPNPFVTAKAAQEEVEFILQHLDEAIREPHVVHRWYVPRVILSLALSYDPLKWSLVEYLQAPSWIHAREVLERNRQDLFDTASDIILYEIVDSSDPEIYPYSTSVLQHRRALLRRCRQDGIDHAFDWLTHEIQNDPSPWWDIPLVLERDAIRIDSLIERSRKDPNVDGELMDAIMDELRFLKHGEHPVFQAVALANLGASYSRLLPDDSSFEAAILNFQRALTIHSEQARQYDCANLQLKLGDLYARSQKGDPTQNTRLAISYLRASLAFFTPKETPREYALASKHLADAYFKLTDWRSAYDAYAAAIRTYEDLYYIAGRPLGEPSALQLDLYDQMVATCLQLQEDPIFVRSALIYAEASKARNYLNQMGLGNLPPPRDVPPKLLKQERILIDLLRRWESRLLLKDGTETEQLEGIDERRRLRQELDTVWDAIAQSSPSASHYIMLRRAYPLTWEDITSLIAELGSDTALVSFYIRESMTVVFVMRDGWQTPSIHTVPLAYERLYHRYFVCFGEEILERNVGRQRTHEWLALGEELLAPLQSLLDNSQLVYFFPHRLLHYLPLHALSSHGTPFIAHHAVACAPSMAVLVRVIEQSKMTKPDSPALVMGYTGNADLQEQALIVGEAREIAEYLGCDALLDDAADVHALHSLAPKAGRIHISSHGAVDATDPMTSALVLTNNALRDIRMTQVRIDDNFDPDDPFATAEVVGGIDEPSAMYTTGSRIYAHDWVELGLQADLVTLSACETGVGIVGDGDEVIGISRALLTAGAASTVVTLWSVAAAMTKLWMLDFYRRIWDRTGRKQQSRAAAFQHATLALREKRDDPYYWAAFVLIGDGR